MHLHDRLQRGDAGGVQLILCRSLTPPSLTMHVELLEVGELLIADEADEVVEALHLDAIVYMIASPRPHCR